MEHNEKSFRRKLEDIIFGHESFRGKFFDVVLLILIVISSLIVILESVVSFRLRFGDFLFLAEIFILFLFLFEYILRIYVAGDRKKYIFSFFGIVDFIAVVPALVSLAFFPLPYLLLLRGFRLFRILRVLKIISFIDEDGLLIRSLKRSAPKILVFLTLVVVVSVVFASIMYVVEGPENGFKDIPTSLYWSIVTLTTVGYGDLVPLTPLGKFIASLLMIGGYAVIAVSTGIVVADYSFFNKKRKNFDDNKKDP